MTTAFHGDQPHSYSRETKHIYWCFCCRCRVCRERIYYYHPSSPNWGNIPRLSLQTEATLYIGNPPTASFSLSCPWTKTPKRLKTAQDSSRTNSRVTNCGNRTCNTLQNSKQTTQGVTARGKQITTANNSRMDYIDRW